MAVVEIARIQVRRGTEGVTGVPQLSPGEFGWAQDTQNLYIGKRMMENGQPTGANSDANTRILTEHDIKGILQRVRTISTSSSTTAAYRYKDIDDPEQTLLDSVTGLLSSKLDNWVSITDFSDFWPPIDPMTSAPTNDITDIIRKAIGTVGNPHGVMVNGAPNITPSIIKIPSGSWTITGLIDLYPLTHLQGDGPEKTILTVAGNVSSQPAVFRTVDAAGNNWDNPVGGSAVTIGSNANPRLVRLEGMTIQYATGTQNASPLISLDIVASAQLTNVHFGDPAASIPTHGIGVKIRSLPVNTGTAAQSTNIVIENCIFNGLDTGVQHSNGTVDGITIRDNQFSLLNYGVSSWQSTLGGLGGMNIDIDNNRFIDIANEAIYIGTATNVKTSYSVSTRNIFRNVGNNLVNDSSQATPVITFNDLGCRSVDDYFERRSNASSGSMNYPVVGGRAVINDSISYQATVGSNIAVAYPILRVPLTGTEQLVTVNYQMVDSTDTVFSRTGTLTMNISASTGSNAYASVSDSYNYSEVQGYDGSVKWVIFSTDYTTHASQNYILLTCYNLLAAPNTDITPIPGVTFNVEYQVNQLQ
jgi:hypothetical protein